MAELVRCSLIALAEIRSQDSGLVARRDNQYSTCVESTITVLLIYSLFLLSMRSSVTSVLEFFYVCDLFY